MWACITGVSNARDRASDCLLKDSLGRNVALRTFASRKQQDNSMLRRAKVTKARFNNPNDAS